MASSLKCNLKIIGAKNVRTTQKGTLFIRSHLFAGNTSTIHLNTPEITLSSTQNADFLFWDDSDFSLECSGTEDSIADLKQDSIVFEIRFRKASLFRKSSQVVARGEIPWKNVFEASKMEIETWVSLSGKKLEGGKAPALKVAVKVEIPAGLTAAEARRRKRREERLRHGSECGCSSSCSCSCAETELLFVTGVFDAL